MRSAAVIIASVAAVLLLTAYVWTKAGLAWAIVTFLLASIVGVVGGSIVFIYSLMPPWLK